LDGLVLSLVAAIIAIALVVLTALTGMRRLNRWLSGASVQTKVRLAPLTARMSTKDDWSTFATVRPTTGDRLPRDVLDQLEQYVASRNAKELPRTLRLEYRDGEWGERQREKPKGLPRSSARASRSRS